MSSGQIVLFDLPSKPPCVAWSLNPWKTRLLLNYKGLDYRTEWLEYPEVRPRLEPHLPPNEISNATNMPYTIPAVMLPTGEYIMESRAIADRLEADHPSPPLHFSSPYLAKVEAIMPGLWPHIRPIFLPRIPHVLLNEASVPYWMETRAGWVGMPLEEFQKTVSAEECWKGVEPVLQEVTGLLEEVKEGPFFMGREVSYADFVWGGFLIFCRRLGDDALEEVYRRSGNAEVHRRLLEGIEPWARRGDH